MGAPHRPRQLTGHAAAQRLLSLVVARAYRAAIVTLLVAATLPALWGWTPSVVRSGSMSPAVAVGDVVVSAPVDADRAIRPGQVILFDRDTSPEVEELVLHRVRSVGKDSQLTTAGDANPTADAAPVDRQQVRGIGVTLVPYVGLPLHWWATRAWLPLVVTLIVTALLLHLAVDRNAGRRGHRRPGGGAKARAAAAAAAASLMVGGAVVGGPALTAAPAAEAAFTARTLNQGSSWRAAYPYVWAVMMDKPALFYQLDEAAGATVARDSGSYAMHGTYKAVAAYREPGATPRTPGTSIRLAGGGGRIISGGPASRIPTTFSIEIWFRTATTHGGKLVGFESSRDALASPNYDRHVFMASDGRLVYGAWRLVSEPTILLTSPASYNDGQWHHLVVTGYVVNGAHRADMFVDGTQVASGPVTTPSDYFGWWRAGHGGLPSGDGYPASPDFNGQLDNIAGYTTRLSAARVKAHYDAR